MTGAKSRTTRSGDGKPLTGIREVARLAGVSIGTVSNVLNNPDVVSEATQIRVRAIVDHLGFVPNHSAVELRYGRSRMIGLVVPDITNPIYAEVARGAVAAASARGYVVVLCNTDNDAPTESRDLEVLHEQRAAGVLLVPSGKPPEQLTRLRERGMRVVFIDRATANTEACSVSLDDVLGGQLAVEHLIQQGAKRIALVNGPSSIRPCVDRRRGARRAIQAAGLPREALVEVAAKPMTVAGGIEAAQRLYEQGPLPDAIFCANDLLAVGVISQLARNGITIPDDVAVGGYDDIETAAEARVPLTTISQPKYDLGQAAAELLLKELDDAGEHRHERLLFRPRLVIRDSTRRAAGVA